MGKITLTVKAGNKTKEIELSTPFQDQEKDQAIVTALEDVAKVKDEGYAGVIEELKADQLTELNTKNAEIAKLREPVIAGIVADRAKVIANLDASKDVEFYSDMTTERLLVEAAHWSESAPAKPVTKPEESKLDTEDDVI